ncbi:MAG: STY4851/ECs_5259 family protein [Methylococcaceae bacterium]
MTKEELIQKKADFQRNNTLNYVTPEKWLTKFLENRDLTYPIQQSLSLFKYKMTDTEYSDLKTTLKFISTINPNVEKLARITKWNEIFVIYGAEWWRREYIGGAWRWITLFSSFDADSSVLSTQQRCEIIRTGLRFWGLKVRMINGNFRYLGTIAIEGGLPLNQLNGNTGWLGKVLGHALSKYIRLHHTGFTVDAIIRECENIPKIYKNDQVYIILGYIVETVVKLKRVYQSDNQADPIAYYPKWREDFPLPIDTEIGKLLISFILGQTPLPSVNNINLPFRGIRSLTDNGTLQLEIEFSGFIALGALKLPETIPPRLDIELVNNLGVTHRLGVALKTSYKGKLSLKMPRPPGVINGEPSAYGYIIRFKHNSTLVHEEPLIGGEELDNEVPWIFVQRNTEWMLEGVASISTKSTQVRILYPDHLNVPLNTQIQPLITLNNKKLIQATGLVQLTDNQNNSFLIKTAQEQSANLYYLQGSKLDFASTPKEIYRGLPTLVCCNNETGERTEINAQGLVARAINAINNNWQPLSPNHQGIYEIRLLDNQGNIKFRKKCVLLPEQFSIRFKPSVDSLDGSIYLENIGTAKVSCDTTIKNNITNQLNGVQIELFANNAPPKNIRLTLYWPGMTEILTLTLPFPARGGQLIDANGDRVLTNRLFQDQLYGFRLRLFNAQPNHKLNLQIHFTLNDATLLDGTGDLYYRETVTKQGAVIELAIIDYQEWIKSLLAISTNLDSYVSLLIVEGGTQLLQITIYRYHFSLEIDHAQGCVALNSTDQVGLSYDSLTQIQLMAMRLSQPEQEHIKLEVQSSQQTATGYWLFTPQKREPGPWMIYPSATSSVSFRPILWQVGAEPVAGILANIDTLTLHSAVTIAQKNLRHNVIKNILERMCTDFEHSGWAYLRHLWKHSQHLPLSSFDVWPLAVTNNKCLTALALQMDESFTQKLGEELPVFWELIPLADWLATFSCYSEYLDQVMDDKADVLTIIQIRIKHISNLGESMTIVAKIINQKLFDVIDPELDFIINNRPIALSEINKAKQELLQRQARNNWPPVLGAKLKADWQKITQPVNLKLDEIPDHKHGVIILPLLLAIYCTNTQTPKTWFGDNTIIFKLKCLKAFDEDWFNTTFRIALAYLSH